MFLIRNIDVVLRVGVIIYGILGFILSLCEGVVYFLKYINDEDDSYVTILIYEVILIIGVLIYLSLIYGVYHRNKYYILPYLIINNICLLLLTIFGFYYLLFTIVYTPEPFLFFMKIVKIFLALGILWCIAYYINTLYNEISDSDAKFYNECPHFVAYIDKEAIIDAKVSTPV